MFGERLSTIWIWRSACGGNEEKEGDTWFHMVGEIVTRKRRSFMSSSTMPFFFFVPIFNFLTTWQDTPLCPRLHSISTFLCTNYPWELHKYRITRYGSRTKNKIKLLQSQHSFDINQIFILVLSYCHHRTCVQFIVGKTPKKTLFRQKIRRVSKRREATKRKGNIEIISSAAGKRQRHFNNSRKKKERKDGREVKWRERHAVQ